MALCMYGYNPFEMDQLTKGKPDPGVRSRIFEPTRFSEEQNAVVVNSFVDYADEINCNIQETTTVVSTMTDYMATMSGSSIFEEMGSGSSNMNVPLWPVSWFVSYKQSYSMKYSNREKSAYEKQYTFFEGNSGEAYINQAKCLVYRVTINKDTPVVFTEAFIDGLRKLQIASSSLDNKLKIEARNAFIREYGTHYFNKVKR